MPKKRSNKYKIIVMNDSLNTFEHVQHCLQEICGHNKYQAYQCTTIIHNNGECQVYSNTEEPCLFIFDELQHNGLKVRLTK